MKKLRPISLLLASLLALCFVDAHPARAQAGAIAWLYCYTGSGAITSSASYLPCSATNPLQVSGGGGGGGAVTIADGADVAEGATTDAAATAGGSGTVSAKLRLMTMQLGTINTTLGSPLQAGGGVTNSVLDVSVALSGMTANNAAAQITLQGTNSVSVLLSGTWVGTLTPQVSADGGTTWVNTLFFNPASQTFTTTVTTTGTFDILGTGGKSHARVLLSPYTSGTVTGNLRAVAQSPSEISALYGLALQTGTAGAPAAAVVTTQGPVSGGSFPTAATPIAATSGNVAAATATATLAAAASKTTYISGFQIAGSGATVGTVVNCTVTNITGGVTLNYPYAAVAGALLMNTPIIVQFNPPLPASAQNTAIAVSCPSLGTGSTNNTVNAMGYQQ